MDAKTESVWARTRALRRIGSEKAFLGYNLCGVPTGIARSVWSSLKTLKATKISVTGTSACAMKLKRCKRLRRPRL